jgi:mono/diheme cytochrome c family protein
MRIVKLFLLFTAVVLFVLACTETENTRTTPANGANAIANNANAAANDINSIPNTSGPTASPTDLAVVRKMFSESCASCHKEDGTGGEAIIEGKKIKAEDLTSESIKKDSDKELFENISEGIPGEGMPAFKDKLTEQQIRDLIRFIRTELQK